MSETQQKRHRPPIRFRTGFRNCIYQACLRRDWVQSIPREGEAPENSSGWDLAWVETAFLRDHFQSLHLRPGQFVNHFPSHFELTRKDAMYTNIRKFRRQLVSAGLTKFAEQMDFVPLTFKLPQEYTMLAEELRRIAAQEPSRGKPPVWIAKPIGGSQGRGIFLFNNMNELSDWRPDAPLFTPEGDRVESYVAQQYLNNPLLIGGRKFDLRLYVLVTSFNPLTVWVARCGFGRFSTLPYDAGTDDLTSHLTNVSLQKKRDGYNAQHGGCKWDASHIRRHMAQRFGRGRTDRCWADIQRLMIRSLQSVASVIGNSANCFEMYGYDVLIDANLRPWLLEVNASPSVTADTPADTHLKVSMLTDVLTIAMLRREAIQHQAAQAAQRPLGSAAPSGRDVHSVGSQSTSLQATFNADPAWLLPPELVERRAAIRRVGVYDLVFVGGPDTQLSALDSGWIGDFATHSNLGTDWADRVQNLLDQRDVLPQI